ITTRLEAQYQELLTATGCADLECLRSLTEEELIHGQHAALQSAYGRHYGYGDFWFGPTIDGDIIRDLPSNEFKKGYFSKVPFLTNRASYEGFSYTPPMLNSISASSDADLIADLKILYPTFTSSPSFLTRLLSLYPPSSYATLFYRRSAIFSDVVVNCPTYHLVSRMGDHMPAWKFVFRTGTQTHGADWRFLWDADFGVVEGDNKTVASMLKDYYIAFTTALDPNALLDAHTGKPEWPSYVPAPRVEGQVVGNQSFDILEFTDGGIEVVRDPDVSDVCDFWASQNWIARN
ncbi:Alpha/Beta hydrolase protein, partial [Clohesyomyces aquaticus]